jgi:hypothetical protein
MNIEEKRKEVFLQAQQAAREFLYKLHKNNYKIPQCVVNGYIESLIAKREICPISLEPLEKETTLVSPCGHAISHHAVLHWIRGAHSCPVCRAEVLESQLQFYFP